MPNTPKGLTYPSSSSPVAVPADIQELATDVDGLIVPNTGGTYTGSVSFTQSPSVPTPTSGLHAVNKTYADLINTDVTAIETELGTNPSGTFSTVVQRLDSYTDGFNKVGNLLPLNVATGTDTLSNTTGFRVVSGSTVITSSTDMAYSGTRSLKVDPSAGFGIVALDSTMRAPVEPGQSYTMTVKVRAAPGVSGSLRLAVAWYTSGGSIVSQELTLPLISVNDTEWAVVSHSGLIAPATAAFADTFIYQASGGLLTSAFYTDEWTFHRGSAGLWSPPGTPVVGQSHVAINNAVHLSGKGSPESVISAAPGSTYLQTDSVVDVKGWIKWIKATGTSTTGWIAGPEADTGWRDVSASASGLTGTSISARVRRVGSTVSYRLNYVQSGAASGVTVLNTAGFLATAPSTFTPAYSNSAGVDDGCVETSATLVKVYTTTAANGGAWSTSLTWATSDAWPSSLPGSAV